MESIDIVFSFDTTGSMYPCIKEVRRNVKAIVKRLFKDIKNIRVGIIAHGDYCDEKVYYLMKSVDFTTDQKKIIDFVNNVGGTGGGDFPEAYEYVLHKVKEFSWNAKNRSLVMIGDAPPHEKNKNPHKLDWRVEAKSLYKDFGVNIYSVQCLDRDYPASNTFYKQLAMFTSGYHMKLDQFSYIRDMMLAICFSHAGEEALENYEQEIKVKKGGMNKGLKHIFDVMLGREPEEEIEVKDEKKPTETIVPCPAAKFQILDVEENCSIKQFVEEMGLTFKRGKGFYEFMKPEKISPKKELILMRNATGDLYEGAGAWKLAGLEDYDVGKRVKPSDIEDYTVFVQSTSYNRKLIGGTRFLYEVDDWDIKE